MCLYRWHFIDTGARQDRIDPVPLAALDLTSEARLLGVKRVCITTTR